MQVSVQKTKSYLVSISVKDSKTEFEKCRKEAIKEIGEHGTFKGFRKGAVPEEVIVREYSEAGIAERAINLYLDANYQKILAKSEILPVSAATVSAVASTSPIDITLEVEILPEAEIDFKKLEKISVKKTAVSASKADAEKALAEMEKRFTHYHEAGAHSEDGFDAANTVIELTDRVTIDTQGCEAKGGKEIPETKVRAFPLVIGSGQFIPGFEEKLIGSKVGDIVEFEITFPADYHADEFKNRKVFFTTTIFKIEKAHKPEWTPEFVEKVRGVKTDKAGLLDILEKEILTERENEARRKDEATLLDELKKITTLEFGPILIEKETELVYKEQVENISGQGLAIKDYLAHIKKTETQYKEEIIRPEAERRLSAELILKKIKDEKKIEASDAQLTAEIEKIIALYQNEEVRTRLKAKLVPGDAYYEDIKTRLAYRNVVDLFVK